MLYESCFEVQTHFISKAIALGGRFAPNGHFLDMFAWSSFRFFMCFMLKACVTPDRSQIIPNTPKCTQKPPESSPGHPQTQKMTTRKIYFFHKNWDFEKQQTKDSKSTMHAREAFDGSNGSSNIVEHCSKAIVWFEFTDFEKKKSEVTKMWLFGPPPKSGHARRFEQLAPPWRRITLQAMQAYALRVIFHKNMKMSRFKRWSVKWIIRGISCGGNDCFDV